MDEDLYVPRSQVVHICLTNTNFVAKCLENAIIMLVSKTHPRRFPLHLRITSNKMTDEDGAAILSALLPLHGHISMLILTETFKIRECHIPQIRSLGLHTLVVRPNDLAACAWAKIGSISGLSMLILARGGKICIFAHYIYTLVPSVAAQIIVIIKHMNNFHNL